MSLQTHSACMYGRSGARVALATMICSLIVSSACIPLPGGYSVSRKTVASKTGTHTLHATDGSTCAVSEKDFADAEVGDLKTCGWGPEGESAGAGAATGVPGGRRPPVTSKPPG